MSSRRPLIAANWKMNMRREEAIAYCARMREVHDPMGPEPAVDAVVFPPFSLLPLVAPGLTATKAVTWGGQDLHSEDRGAHTGDISALHLVDWMCTWALCGHSERRADHAESDELVGRKAAAARRNGLRPMLCVGETGDEREQGLTEEVLSRQLAAALDAAPLAEPDAWALAYEPVWAIGTGLTATPELAQEAHAFLRSRIAEALGEGAADGLSILYGGSVKAENCEALLAQPDIDGFLIGGASLDPDSFLDIIRRCGSV
jgi:triosephosphate isomerase